ncbi:nitrogenase cofactor biosynthesis protein NifB [Rhodobacter veldkampii DSM 11550]|uniref:FeMo cofactor biosynthesis protein NifB n=1 Tax=Phaeovulum veldkampii DSM 11550 TaxID=1185920 RepID=A0A2T4JFX6_9RHOB|nr:nitrogenase cofactor biosynthesis protein NifB [Phaeovulum veldkampii]MBK5945157.1 nitrogenase cofactor biosynthesis protein NifB [Phaeovulum veldkampii DSM 11550]PTE16812.1 nitrogenase cofactor biosynthesis protein NifB [Phaeovulum veldkampii DSM 11550]TDQ54671.1 nitrogen fixation protein NifB [Phaeovulum veldkampii DSM 11550]
MAGNIISLGGLQVASRDDLGKALGAGSAGGCASSGCGSTAGPADMDPATWAKVKDHPCYSEEAHHYFARMHVAVAPACNIQCNYCNRKYDCSNESRPGVVSERLTPDQAARKVLAVAAAVPQLSVLGIAGPGDAAFDWKRTKATFDLVQARLPDIKLCLSSNGLALPDHVEELVAMRVDHVTITINTLDPEVGAQIYPWIYFRGARLTGVEASRILIERQMQSLDLLVARGILVKVNSVLIPGINDAGMIELNKVVKARGAFLHNIMPLISDPAHGTHFGLTGQRGPTAAELQAVQEACAGGANLMRHCRQCRADAVGMLGEDRGQEFTLDKLPETVEDAPEARAAWRAWVAREREDRREASAAAAALLPAALQPAAPPMLVAVATRGGGRINQHFGHATEFQVYQVDTAGVRFVTHRRADNYCLDGHGEDDRLAEIIRTLEGVPVVLCSRIGEAPRARLASAGIEVIDAHAEDYIEAAISAVYATRNPQSGALTA